MQNQENKSLADSKTKRSSKKNDTANCNGKEDDCNIECTAVVTKEPKKIASIFMKNNKKVKKTDPSVLEARKKFLMSCAPDIVRRQLDECHNQSSNSEQEISSFYIFPQTTHVRQGQSPERRAVSSLPFSLSSGSRDVPSVPRTTHIGQVTKLKSSERGKNKKSAFSLERSKLSAEAARGILSQIKDENKGIAVNFIFKQFYERKCLAEQSEKSSERVIEVVDLELESKKRKRGRKKKRKQSLDNEEKEISAGENYCHKMWTEKYKPLTFHHVIGNYAVINRLKYWLKDWKGLSKQKKNSQCSNDSSSDSSSSYDDEDINNTAVVTGPVGIGKTATIYALARDLSFKVLEVNASSHRTGKQVLAQLAEATQSHHMSKTNKSVVDFFDSSKKKEFSTNSLIVPNEHQAHSRMAVILFEDIDIVFEEHDEGFISAVNNLIANTKRPIILTSSTPNYWEQTKLKFECEKYEFVCPKKELVAIHLQLMCLAEMYYVSKKDIEELLQANHNSIQKTILDLQFCLMSGENNHDSMGEADKSLLESSYGYEPLEDDYILTKVNPDSMETADVFAVQDFNSCIKLEVEDAEIDKLMSCKHVRTNDGPTNRSSFRILSILDGVPSKSHIGIIEDEHVYHKMFTHNLIDERYLMNGLPLPKCGYFKKRLQPFPISVENNSKYKQLLTSASNKILKCLNGENVPVQGNSEAEPDKDKKEILEKRKNLGKCIKTLSNMLDSCSALSTLYEFNSLDDKNVSNSLCAEWGVDEFRNYPLIDSGVNATEIAAYGSYLTKSIYSQEIERLAQEFTFTKEMNYTKKLPFHKLSLEEELYRQKIQSHENELQKKIFEASKKTFSVDVAAFMRAICRSEEFRRIEFVNEKRRSARFLHHFDSNLLSLSHNTIILLCNSFSS